MAAQAVGKAASMLMAGAAGAFIFQNAERVSEVFADVSRAVVHSMSKPRDGGARGSTSTTSGSSDGTVSRLAQQVDQLTQELRRLAMQRNQEITLVTNDNQGTSAGGRLVQVLVVVGGGGYLYLWWKGYTFQDFMYVTRGSFTRSLKAIDSSMAGVKSHLQAAKTDIERKLGLLSDRQDKNTAEIKSQIAQEITGVNRQLEEISGHQNYTSQGIYLLTQVVSDVIGPSNSAAAKQLEAFTRTQPASLTYTSTQGLSSVQSLSSQESEDRQNGNGANVMLRTQLLPNRNYSGSNDHGLAGLS